MKDHQRAGLTIMLTIIYTIQVMSVLDQRWGDPGVEFSLIILTALGSLGIALLMYREEEG